MPLNPSRALKETIPVARPALPFASLVPAPEEPVEATWFTSESLKGWGSSLVLHGTLLVVMALWYFVPKTNPPRVFDTRLAGSEMGVDEGLTATGGLNTPIEMSPSLQEADSTLSTVSPIDLSELEAKLSSLADAKKPSAGGGMDNPNPGAGEGDGFGLARFGQGGENIRGVEVKVGDPQFTLLWDTEADLDLHVVEPGGKEIYWEDPKGQRGGELDVDNTKGFGPENIYWLREVEATGEKVKGPGPPGEYKWFVVYWGGFGGVAKPTKWKVRIKHDGKVTIVTGKFNKLNERSKVHAFKVEGLNPGKAELSASP